MYGKLTQTAYFLPAILTQRLLCHEEVVMGNADAHAHTHTHTHTHTHAHTHTHTHSTAALSCFTALCPGGTRGLISPPLAFPNLALTPPPHGRESDTGAHLGWARALQGEAR